MNTYLSRVQVLSNPLPFLEPPGRGEGEGGEALPSSAQVLLLPLVSPYVWTQADILTYENLQLQHLCASVIIPPLICVCIPSSRPTLPVMLHLFQSLSDHCT